MFKIVRNTVFTFGALALTVFALQGHGRVTVNQQRAAANATVLAGQSYDSATPDFPLKIIFNAPQVRLGQTETVTLRTLPGAQLEVITQYPDGSVNHPSTFKRPVSASGRENFSVTVNDFHNLGLVRVSAVATIGSKTTQAIGQFEVAPWELGQSGGYQYTFPLVP